MLNKQRSLDISYCIWCQDLQTICMCCYCVHVVCGSTKSRSVETATAALHYIRNRFGYCITGMTPVQMVPSVAQEEEVNANMLRVGCTAAQVCLPFSPHLETSSINVPGPPKM